MYILIHTLYYVEYTFTISVLIMKMYCYVVCHTICFIFTTCFICCWGFLKKIHSNFVSVCMQVGGWVCVIWVYIWPFGFCNYDINIIKSVVSVYFPTSIGIQTMNENQSIFTWILLDCFGYEWWTLGSGISNRNLYIYHKLKCIHIF